MKKHIVCLGDSNTHGYCADPKDTEEGSGRFNEDERWTCLLQKALGEEYLVLEEGLSGRTTVFRDPLHESMDAIGSAYAILMSHEPVDLLIIMLGTNDTKERFSATPANIAAGLERLLLKCICTDCWGGNAPQPRILVVCPPRILPEMNDEGMGTGCAEKSAALAPRFAEVSRHLGVAFLDAEGCPMNTLDCMHLTREGHRRLAERLLPLVRTLA